MQDWSSFYGNPWGDLSVFRSRMTGQTIIKGQGNDAISGTSGEDLVRAYGGNDRITAGAGHDWIDAGRGNDTVWAGAGADFAQGGDGNDQLSGETGDDWIDGGAGGDRLSGGDGDDQIHAWTGDDALYGDAGNDILDGGPGSDQVDGGTGNDILYAGSSGADVLRGGLGDNQLFGWELKPYPEARTEGPGNSVTYYLAGRNDTVWDNGISTDRDTLVYQGRGSAEVRWFGGAAQVVYDETYALPPYAASGTSDRVVLEKVAVGGNVIDDFQEFTQMIADGRIGFSSDRNAESGYRPLDMTGSYRGHWTNVGNISLDFGPGPDGTPRRLTFLQTSLSGIDGPASLSPTDWQFA